MTVPVSERAAREIDALQPWQAKLALRRLVEYGHNANVLSAIRWATHDRNAFYVIEESDVGQRSIRAFDQVWLVANFIGQIFPSDVGKRVYLRGDIVQVENDQQVQARRDRTS